MFDYTDKNKVQLFFTYKSLDKYLYYLHWRTDRISFWEKDLVDNFNFSEPQYKEREYVKITLFNTSHIIIQGMDIEAYELDETEGMWPWKYWIGYDES